MSRDSPTKADVQDFSIATYSMSASELSHVTRGHLAAVGRTECAVMEPPFVLNGITVRTIYNTQGRGAYE